jgi:hypothetical protein
MTHFKNLKEEEKYYREEYSGKLVGKTLEKIAMYKTVSEEFILKYGNKPTTMESRNYKYWDRKWNKDTMWSFFSEYQPLSLKFIEENKEQVEFKALAYNKNLDVEIVKHYYEAGVFNEGSLSEIELSEDYIESIFEKLRNKTYLVIQNKLSEEFIEKHISELDLTDVFAHDFISEEFITKHYDKIENTYRLANNRKLSENFIERHLEDLNKFESFYDRELSFDFYKRNKEKINWFNASQYITFEGEQLIEMKNHIQWFRYFKRYQRTAPIPSVLLDEMSQYVDLDTFVKKQDLDQWFINKHYANLDASSVWEHQTLSEELIKNNIEEIKWKYAYKQLNIPMEVMRKNINCLNDNLIKRRLLDEDILDVLFEKYVKEENNYNARYYLSAIALYQDFSPVFYKKYSKVLEKYDLEDNNNLNETVKAKYIQKKKLSTMFKKN